MLKRLPTCRVGQCTGEREGDEWADGRLAKREIMRGGSRTSWREREGERNRNRLGHFGQGPNGRLFCFFLFLSFYTFVIFIKIFQKIL
jgi:hypothetical protein